MVSSYEDPTDVVISSAAAASTPKTVVHKAINACLAPLCSVEGCHVVTVEGIGSIAKGLHPVQQRVADFHGSQCGFCTPGIVMALYTFFRNNPNATQHEVEESMDGNLCRCTGYRPILDGAKSLASDNGCCGGSNGGGCERLAVTNAGASESKDKKEYGLTTVQSSSHAKIKNYPRYVDLNDPLSIYKTDQKVSSGGSSSNSNENESKTAAMKPLLELSFPEFLTSHPTVPLKLTSSACTWYRPTTLESLAALKHQFPKAKIVVGNTEVGVETKFKFCAYPVRIATTHIPRLKQLSFDANTDALTIGASVTLTAIKTQLSHMMDGINSSSASSSAMGLKPHHLPTLNAIVTQLRWFSSTQIRNAACIAGNIATASPISDMNPVLQACNATLVLQSHAATGRVVMYVWGHVPVSYAYMRVDG